MEYKTGLRLNTTKLLGFRMHYICSYSQGCGVEGNYSAFKEYLHITVATGGPFESTVGLLAHCSWRWGPL